METKFTHFDEQGNAVMVDVSEKNPTSRTALAEGKIQVNREVMDAILHHTVKKGDVLGVARVAGIMAVKQTSSLIPMCHVLPISKCSVDFEIEEENLTIKALCMVKVEGKTGVEMDSLETVSFSGTELGRCHYCYSFYLYPGKINSFGREDCKRIPECRGTFWKY